MASSPHRTLKKAIEGRSFDPVYFFYGENEFSKDEAIRQLIEAAVDPATRDFNLEVRRGANLDASAVATLLATPPMMAERRLVLIREAEALRKDARAEVDRYLSRPSRDTVLVLAGTESPKADKTLQQAATLVEFPPLNENQVLQWITRHVSASGGTITEDAVQLLHSAAGNDLPQLATEIDKLLSFSSGTEIDAHAVSSVVGVRAGETLPDFLDCLTKRDAVGALRLLPGILSQPKMTAVYLVMIMTVHVLAIAWGRAKRDEGASMSIIEREYYALLKETGAGSTGRPWGEAIRAWSAAIPRWPAESCDHAIEALMTTDAALKETRVSTEEQLMGSLLLSMCAPLDSAAVA